MFIILAGAEAGLSRSSTSRVGSWVSLPFSIQGRGRSLALRAGRTSTTRGWLTAGVASISTLGSPAWLPVPPPAARAVVAPCARVDRPRHRAPLERRSCSGAVLPLQRYGASARPGGSEWGSADGLTLRSSVPRWMRLEKSPSPTGSLSPSALRAPGSLYLSSPLERRRGRGQGCSGVRPEAIAAAVGSEPEFRLYWHFECRCFVHCGCRGLNMYVFLAWSRVFSSFRALILACWLSEPLHQS
jgi:hypothetical protein